MSEETRHDYIKGLLAVVAVHAASKTETKSVEEHVVTCDECRHELDEHRRVTTLLGSGPALPPDSVWEKLSTTISEPPPPFRLVKQPHPKRFERIGAIAAAVVLVACGALGASLLRSDDNGPEQDLAAARNESGARAVALTSPTGKHMAEAVLLPDGRGYLVGTELPAAPHDRTYQLWAVTDSGAVLSAGVLGNDPGIAPFTVAGNVRAFAITEEISGGVPKSSNEPAASGAFA